MMLRFDLEELQRWYDEQPAVLLVSKRGKVIRIPVACKDDIAWLKERLGYVEVDEPEYETDEVSK